MDDAMTATDESDRLVAAWPVDESTVGEPTHGSGESLLVPTPDDIVIETLAADVSERGATRMDDKTSEASMEKRKKDGYF